MGRYSIIVCVRREEEIKEGGFMRKNLIFFKNLIPAPSIEEERKGIN